MPLRRQGQCQVARAPNLEHSHPNYNVSPHKLQVRRTAFPYTVPIRFLVPVQKSGNMTDESHYNLRRPISHPTGLSMTCGGMSQAHLQPERAMNYKARTEGGLQIDCI